MFYPLFPQVSSPASRRLRYELSDYEWTVIKPMLPNKPRRRLATR